MTSIRIEEDDAGVRLDRFLRKRLKLRTLSQIYRMIRQGDVRVNGKKAKENSRLALGDLVEMAVDKPELTASQGGSDAHLVDLAQTEYFRKNFRVLYEDDVLLACNKPPHLVVHSGTGHEGADTMIDLAKSYLLTSGTASSGEPALVHRIDRDTSGVVLIAKNRTALRTLHESFRERDVQKHYLAVCHGTPPHHSGTISAPIERTYGRNDGTKMQVGDEGLDAESSYEVLRAHGGLSKLSVDLHTGRTHQIRVHLEHAGCPIVGDVRYGDPTRDEALFARRSVARRLYLHAHTIRVPHPLLKRTITITAPEPREFGTVMESGERH
jgi:RluA family pseudouridine synthase